jgi:site-specific DNA recombinase
MTKPTKPCDISVRVSRVGGREHMTSLEDQERDGRSFAQEHGITVGKVLTDRDKSGGTLDRPGLVEAVERVRAGVSGGIIVAYLSRLSRDTRQGLELLEEITRAGGAVFAPNLPDYTTADGRMLTTLQLAIDTGYRERKSEELERAKAGAIERGIPVKTRPPVGFRRRSRKDRRLMPDPAVAPVVREVFERRALGEGPGGLGAFLTSKGVRTSQGSKTWSKQAVYKLLRNRVYLGELHYGRDGRYVNATAHEPLVDEATWQAAQHPNGRLLARTRWGANLLAGIGRCRACRYCLSWTTSSRGKRIYRCTKTHAGGVCPDPARGLAEPVERMAVEAFWKLTADLEAEGVRDDHGNLAGLESALVKAERRLRDWASPAVQEKIGDIGLYADGLKTRRQTRDQAAEALGHARAETTLPPLRTKTLRSEWKRMTTEERRDLLALRIDAISLDRAGNMVVYPAGAGPAGLPTRGHRPAVLVPFPDVPAGARKTTLEPAGEPAP